MAERNEVTPRSTEGTRDTAPESMKRRSRGRPAGSRNKPKGLVPVELASEILLVMKDQLPPDQFDYMKGVIQQGDAISTRRELDILIMLLNRNLAPALVSEMSEKDDDGKPLLRKDVTERVKVLNSLLNLRHQLDKTDDKKGDDGENPLLKLWAARGMKTRVAILIEGEKKPEEAPQQLESSDVIEGEFTEVGD